MYKYQFHFRRFTPRQNIFIRRNVVARAFVEARLAIVYHSIRHKNLNMYVCMYLPTYIFLKLSK